MNRLNRMQSAGRTWWKSKKDLPFFKSQPEKFGMRHEEVTSANGWRTGVFLREPAERFASAWRSKCVAWERDGADCLGGEQANGSAESQVKSFERVVFEQIPKYHMWRQRFNNTYNAHYDPQSSFCGGLSKFDFIGRLTSDTISVNSQVTQMLREVARVPEDLLETVNVESLFPKQRVQGHHEEKPSLSELYRDPKVLAAVREFYQADYDVWGK